MPKSIKLYKNFSPTPPPKKIFGKKTFSQILSLTENPKNGKIEAASGKKDDLIISLGLSLLGRSYYFSRYPEEKILKQIGKNLEIKEEKIGSRASLLPRISQNFNKKDPIVDKLINIFGPKVLPQ